MKTVDLKQTSLNTCIEDAQNERVLITSAGKPVALVVGVEELDEEQLELAGSKRFWSLIAERRKQKTLTRAELEQIQSGTDSLIDPAAGRDQ